MQINQEPTFLIHEIPLALGPELRLQLSLLAFNFDRMQVAAEDLVRLADRVGKNGRDLPSVVHTRLLSHALVIIDACYSIEKLLEAKYFDGVEKNPQKKALADVRNHIDHLHQNFKNLGNKKAKPPSIFGVLSYCVAQQQDVLAHMRGLAKTLPIHHIIIAPGAVEPSFNQAVADPRGLVVRGGASNFKIQAGDHLVQLDQLVEHIERAVRSIDRSTYEEFEEVALAYGVGGGLSFEELWNSAGSSLFMAVDSIIGRGQ